MTGQFVVNPSELVPIDDLIRRYPLLERYHDRLASARDLLVGDRQPEDEEERYTKQFHISQDDFTKKARMLTENARGIAEVANARYRDVRSRFESVFKEEMLGRTYAMQEESKGFRQLVKTVLPRMREFWAFKGAYLLNCSLKSNVLSIIAWSTAGKESSFLPVPIPLGVIEPALPHGHRATLVI